MDTENNNQEALGSIESHPDQSAEAIEQAKLDEAANNLEQDSDKDPITALKNLIARGIAKLR